MDSEFDTIVVGAGVWGAAAIEAHEKAGRSVAWIDDKHDEASTASADIVRIIRGEYSDSAYRALGEEAIGIFKTQKPYSDHYHHTGWFMVEDKQQGQHRSVPRGTLDVSAEEFMRSFPSAPPEKLSTLRITKTGNVGWAEANKLQQALHAASRVKVRKGTVSRLVLDDLGRFRGVELDTGEILRGKYVMLATGWRANQLLAPQNFRQVDCRVVGVPKLGIKLTDEQYAKYRDMPILVQQGRGKNISLMSYF
jgi:glycine/D-amino acid oxidase-like deaminating enzyme